MSLLDGGIRDVFGSVFGAIYEDATLVAVTRTESTDGDITVTTANHAVKAHAPSRSAAYREAAGFADDEVEIILLQAGMTVVPTTDMRLTYKGRGYSITRVDGDGAHSQWRLRAKIRTEVVPPPPPPPPPPPDEEEGDDEG